MIWRRSASERAWVCQDTQAHGSTQLPPYRWGYQKPVVKNDNVCRTSRTVRVILDRVSKQGQILDVWRGQGDNIIVGKIIARQIEDSNGIEMRQGTDIAYLEDNKTDGK